MDIYSLGEDEKKGYKTTAKEMFEDGGAADCIIPIRTVSMNSTSGGNNLKSKGSSNKNSFNVGAMSKKFGMLNKTKQKSPVARNQVKKPTATKKTTTKIATIKATIITQNITNCFFLFFASIAEYI